MGKLEWCDESEIAEKVVGYRRELIGRGLPADQIMGLVIPFQSALVWSLDDGDGPFGPDEEPWERSLSGPTREVKELMESAAKLLSGWDRGEEEAAMIELVEDLRSALSRAET